MPEGWKSAIITMNSFGKMVESVRFLSPDGRFCTSRVEAIKYLLKDGGANHDDLMRMQMGLLQVSFEHFLLFYEMETYRMVGRLTKTCHWGGS